MKTESISPELTEQIDFELEQSHEMQALRCHNPKCPYIFYQERGGQAHITQGSCNSWLCPRCGHIRARKEYARIINGVDILASSALPLYFWTLTCQGRDMPLAEAERDYLKWTDRLLTAARNKAHRAGQFWYYVQVTERQARKHPHSHLISTFCPADSVSYSKGESLPNGRIAKRATLWSEWFRGANVRAGLGIECDLSLIRTPRAVAVYVSKYLFKDAMNTKWPPGWKRVRYSNSWPKLLEPELINAFPLVKLKDWKRMENLGLTVHADSETTYYAALARLILCVVPPKKSLNETLYH